MELFILIFLLAILMMVLVAGWYLKWAYMNFWRDPVGWVVIFKSYPSGKLIRGRVIDHHNRPFYPMYLIKCQTGVRERWVLKKRCFLYPF